MNASEKTLLKEKLDKIIEQNNYIIALLESMNDDATAVADIQRRMQQMRKTMREMEIEQWMKEYGKKPSTPKQEDKNTQKG